MRRICTVVMALALVFGFSASTTHAEFINLGGGMIYDTDLDITWLQDANYAQTSGHDADGLMTFDEANIWAATLVYGGTGGWRLPTFDPSNPRPPAITTENEIGWLRTRLAGGANEGLYYPDDPSPFINLLYLSSESNEYRDVYWTGLAGDPGYAWDYYMGCG